MRIASGVGDRRRDRESPSPRPDEPASLLGRAGRGHRLEETDGFDRRSFLLLRSAVDRAQVVAPHTSGPPPPTPPRLPARRAVAESLPRQAFLETLPGILPGKTGRLACEHTSSPSLNLDGPGLLGRFEIVRSFVVVKAGQQLRCDVGPVPDGEPKGFLQKYIPCHGLESTTRRGLALNHPARAGRRLRRRRSAGKPSYELTWVRMGVLVWHNDKLDRSLLARIGPALEALKRLGAEEVWLLGSQALGPNEDRDVDLLVIGPAGLRERLAEAPRPRPEIDVLVNVRGENDFSEPWEREDEPGKVIKRGDFTSWCWYRKCATEAEYLGAKSLGPRDPPDYPQPAILLFTRDWPCEGANL